MLEQRSRVIQECGVQKGCMATSCNEAGAAVAPLPACIRYLHDSHMKRVSMQFMYKDSARYVSN